MSAGSDPRSDVSECIEWTGAIHHTGYGVRTIKRKQWRVHRLAWIEAHGPIPDGLLVLHSCDNRRCYNLEHLRLGTDADNARDRSERGRHSGNGRREWTHCKHGHEFTEENTYLYPKTGYRRCKICLNANSRERKRRLRNAR